MLASKPMTVDEKSGCMESNIKKEITDEEIIELYKSGWSQKSIVNTFDVAVLRTRMVLKNAGFKTNRFRALNEDAKEVAMLLVRYGIEYTRIERVTDISFYAVREVVEKNNLHGLSKQARTSNLLDEFLKGFTPDEEDKKLIQFYQEGATFVNLCKEFNLDENQILHFFLAISEKDVAKHQKALKQILIQEAEKDHMQDYIFLANKYMISTSILKRYILKKKKK